MGFGEGLVHGGISDALYEGWFFLVVPPVAKGGCENFGVMDFKRLLVGLKNCERLVNIRMGSGSELGNFFSKLTNFGSCTECFPLRPLRLGRFPIKLHLGVGAISSVKI